MGGVTVRPVTGVDARVLDNGWMELHHPGGGALLCNLEETAMWLCLAENGWHVGDAAIRLADAWGCQPWNVRDRMNDWLDGLLAAGLVTHTPK
ncbi:hypothetical protein Ae406Ps2_1461 [Pseudonocardia sp. Ae406_Ps2]|nr:hypothetical protein Ae406Ps2_1461 [Pseudonocardia sp. Ae406_Ps2]OLM06738.1 hypothetical protein Ae331Ps2_4448c [Pseudonocardia sp. Ae331_Ps2]OLM23032.1 hypothetical protein Ae706Ps2_1465 [Pseudonocardia sp. Ae706_Ps2]